MKLDGIEWEYSVRIGLTWHGRGQSALMLPALSSIRLEERCGRRRSALDCSSQPWPSIGRVLVIDLDFR
jgi:hypothetical protein